MNQQEKTNRKSPVLLVNILIPAIVIALFFGGYKLLCIAQASMPTSATTLNSKIIATSPQMPDKFLFAGEEVPLQYFDVYESFERELITTCYSHTTTLINLKRRARYYPMIETILRQYGVPDDFKHLAVAESNLSNAVSSVGAKGFWQFMDPTAKQFDLIINENVDERYHIEKSTHAACKFLLRAYKKYQNWSLVMASYNFGSGNLDETIKTQKADNYYDLWLNTETARYVFRILAIKLVYDNPQQYGFDLKPVEEYQAIPTYDVKVDTSITNLAYFAQSQGTNYKMLKYFNQWLRQSNLLNKERREYFIKIPEKNARIRTSNQ